MSNYKIVLKPGGVGGRNVGVGINLAKKPLLSPEQIAALSAVVPVSTSLEVTVIYPVGMIGASVQITGPDAFDQTIVNTMTFDPITAGDYIIVAAAVAGHTVRVFTSPVSVADKKTACALVLYDVIATVVGGAKLSVYVAIISNDANLVADVNVSDGAGFSQAIIDAGDHVFADVQPGTYTVTANNIDDGNGNTLVASVFQSPATLLADEHACILVVYAAAAGTAPGLLIKLQPNGDPDFGGSVSGGSIILGVYNSNGDLVLQTSSGNAFVQGVFPPGTYTGGVSDSGGLNFTSSGGGTLTGGVGDTIEFLIHGEFI